MKKDRIKEKLRLSCSMHLSVLVLALVLSLSLSRPALAQCETAADTAAPLATLVANDISNLNLLITEEESFMDNIMQTAYKQLVAFYATFAKNVEDAITSLASNDWKSAMAGMTQELHFAQVDQTYRLGQMVDAQLLVEEASRRENHIVDAHRRYAPSDLACEMDSIAPGIARSFQISRALNRTLALDDTPRHENAMASPAAKGKAADINATWLQYLAKFCDPSMGDEGCTAPGTLAGTPAGHYKDIGALLWGTQQTIDPSNPDNVLEMQMALRLIVDPLAADPIPPKSVNSEAGHAALLARHSELAYVNTIYNTLGAMLSERIGGSGVDVSLMREAAGVPPTDTAAGILPNVGASYREIQEAITRDRFNNPNYLARLIGDSSQVAREQTVLNALRLQTMNDTFRRLEERLFMESAGYGIDLNSQIPHAAVNNMPFK